MKYLLPLLLVACASQTPEEREYRLANELNNYIYRMTHCDGIWVTAFPPEDVAKANVFDLRRAYCAERW